MVEVSEQIEKRTTEEKRTIEEKRREKQGAVQIQECYYSRSLIKMSQMPQMPSLALPTNAVRDDQDAQEEKTMMSLLLQIQKAKEKESQSKKVFM